MIFCLCLSTVWRLLIYLQSRKIKRLARLGAICQLLRAAGPGSANIASAGWQEYRVTQFPEEKLSAEGELSSYIRPSSGERRYTSSGKLAPSKCQRDAVRNCESSTNDSKQSGRGRVTVFMRDSNIKGLIFCWVLKTRDPPLESSYWSFEEARGSFELRGSFYFWNFNFQLLTYLLGRCLKTCW